MATFKNMQAIQFIEESAESIMNGTNDYENVVHNIVPTPGKRKAAEMGSDDESEGETPANMTPETRNLAGMKPAKKTKGRVKIKMEFIENKIRRYTTFSKRKTGIMKKAYELSTLTGTQVMLLVASETGHVYTFATRKLQPMITSESGKALIQTCLNSPDQDGPPVMLPHTTSNIPSGRGGDQRMNPAGYEEPELGYVEDDDSSKSSSSVPSVSAKPTPPPPLTAHNTGPILPVAKPSVYVAPRSAPTDIHHHPHHHHSSAATTPAASPSPAPPPAHMPTNNHTSSATTSTHQLAHVGGVTAGAVGVSTAPIQLTSTPVTMTTPSIAQTPLMYMASPPPSATAGKPLAINLPAGFVLPPGIPPGTPIAIGAIPSTQQHASTIYRFPTPPTSAGGGASAATAQILQIPATPTVQTATGAATKVEPSALHHQTDATSGFAALGGALGGMLSSAGLSLASTPQPSVQVIGTPQPPPAHTTPAQTTPAGITVLPGMTAVSQSGVNGSSSSSGAIAATPTPAGATMLYQTPHGALLCGTPNPLTNESSFLLNLPQTPTAGAAATATLPVQLAAAAAAVQQQGGGHPSATLAAANAEQTAGQQQYITIPVPVSLGAANQQVLQSVLSALSSDTQFFEKLQK